MTQPSALAVTDPADRTTFEGTPRIRRLAIGIHDHLWSQRSMRDTAQANQTDLAQLLGVDQGSISRAVTYGTERGWFRIEQRGFRGRPTKYRVTDPEVAVERD